MYRLLAGGFSLTVIMLSILGVSNPEGTLSVVMSTDMHVTLFRIALCSLLLAYSVSPALRYDLPGKTLSLASWGIVCFFITSLFTDTTAFPRPLDLFFGLEGAFLSAIAVFDFERPKKVQRFMPHVDMSWAVGLGSKLKQLRPTLQPSRQKHA